MKIIVKGNDHNINLILPTSFLLNRFVLKLILKNSGYIENFATIPPEKMELLFSELHRIRKRYKHWNLVEVDSADGEHIRITL